MGDVPCVLGRGGTGAVYGVTDQRTPQVWALKELWSDNPAFDDEHLKPANIMVREDGDVRLVDFGIARYFAKGASNDTQALGTPGYAAPEQYGGGQSDQRSDVYALGANVHQMLTGINPGHSPFRFDALRTHCPEISPEFEKAVAKCVELDQGRRPQNVAEFRDELLEEIRRRNGGELPAELEVFQDSGVLAATDEESSSVLDSEGLAKEEVRPQEAADQESRESPASETTSVGAEEPKLNKASGLVPAILAAAVLLLVVAFLAVR